MNFLSSIGNYQFANQYGEYAEGFDMINSIGSPSLKAMTPLFVFFVSLIIGIVMIVKSQPPKPMAEQPPVERTSTQQILKGVSTAFFIFSVLSLIVYGIVYLFYYLPQYKDWFDSLPNEAKLQITAMFLAQKFSNGS